MKKAVFHILLTLALLTSCQEAKKRDVISLNGTWQVAEGKMNEIPTLFSHSVPVPGLISLATPPFTNAGPKVADRRSLVQKDTLREAFWYFTTFSIDRTIPPVAVLKVSKAMFGTKVFVNGIDVGEHLPCFTPGYFNVKDALKKGENRLLIRIGSCRNSVPFSVPDGFDFEKDRYIPGIFDNVELILTGIPDIISVQAAPDISESKVRVQVKLDSHGESGASKVVFVVTEAKSGRISGRELHSSAKKTNP